MEERMIPKPPSNVDNSEQIDIIATEVQDELKRQQHEIDSLDELDDLLIQLTRKNKVRKEKTADVKRKMRYLDSQL